MDERKNSARNRQAARGGGDEWRLDPSDVRRYQRLRKTNRGGGWLGKALKFGFAGLLLVGAGALWLNRESLRGVTVDTSAFDRLLGRDAPADGSGRRPLFGGTPETVEVEGGGVAGTAAQTSLDGSAPPPPDAAAQAPAPAAGESQVAAARGFAPPQPADGNAAAPGAQSAPAATADTGGANSAAVAPAEPIAEAAPAPEPAAPPPRPEPEPDPGPELFGFAAKSFDLDAVVEVSEADANAAVIVARSGGRRAPTTITWWTSDGTASAGSDYADRGVLVEKFAQGEQNRTLRVPIVGGSTKEADETFYVHFAPNDADGTPIKSEEQKIEVVIKDDD